MKKKTVYIARIFNSKHNDNGINSYLTKTTFINSYLYLN